VRRLAAAAAAVLLAAGSARGQALPTAPGAVAHGTGNSPAAAATLPSPVAERHIVVSLEEHRLYVVENGRAHWSAVIGTGTGTRLAGAGQTWDFSTPRGMFRVQVKQKDPVWFLPDWYFVERGERVPPPDSPLRRREGELGTSALFLGEEIAIHGTDRPELLGDDVSHGCIRVTNEDARRLYHEVEIGTPVLIY
jgi:lipoprotein-anchoring transpeptidase ErfK/SrfK